MPTHCLTLRVPLRCPPFSGDDHATNNITAYDFERVLKQLAELQEKVGEDVACGVGMLLCTSIIGEVVSRPQTERPKNRWQP